MKSKNKNVVERKTHYIFPKNDFNDYCKTFKWYKETAT